MKNRKHYRIQDLDGGPLSDILGGPLSNGLKRAMSLPAIGDKVILDRKGKILSISSNGVTYEIRYLRASQAKAVLRTAIGGISLKGTVQ